MRRVNWSILAVLVLAAASGGCGISKRVAADRYDAGRFAMAGGNYAQALEELAKAVEADPELSVAHAAIGDIYRKQGNHEAAATSYERACETDPYAFRPHYNLALTYQVLAEAARSSTRAAEFLCKAVHTYLRAVMLQPNDFDTHLNLSACFFQQGKFALAEKYCKAAIRIRPRQAAALCNLGIIYDALNRPHDAIRAYRGSLELDVHQPVLLVNLGGTYFRLKRLGDALNAFNLATRQDPNFASAWERTAACLYHMKRYADSLSAYDRAVRLDARSAASQRGLGVACMTLYVKDSTRREFRDKGLAAWGRSLALDPNQPRLRQLLAKYSPKKPAAPSL